MANSSRARSWRQWEKLDTQIVMSMVEIIEISKGRRQWQGGKKLIDAIIEWLADDEPPHLIVRYEEMCGMKFKEVRVVSVNL